MKPKQEKFIMALMSTSTTEEAYKKAGIAQSTAYNYLNDPVFKEEYRRIRCYGASDKQVAAIRFNCGGNIKSGDG